MYDKFKVLLGDDGVFYSCLILLVGVTSFGLGRYSIEESNVKTQNASVIMTKEASSSTFDDNLQLNQESNPSEVDINGMYVGSKNGTKYHLPWCPGAKQMKEENKIWFKDKPAALAAGYTPAGNCKGI